MASGTWSIRLGLGVLLISLITFDGMLTAQGPKKKPFDDEEEPVKKKPVKKPPREEEEEPAPKERTKASISSIPTLKGLVVPHDLVQFKETKSIKVDPAPRLVREGHRNSGKVFLQQFNEQWEKVGKFEYSWNEIRLILPYEEMVLQGVSDYVKSNLEGEQVGSKKYVDTLQTAEDLLALTVRFHEAARAGGQREGPAWDAVADRLRENLLTTQLQLLKTYVDLDQWNRAYELAEVLVRAYPKEEHIAKELGRFIERSLQEERYDEVQRRLRLYQELFPADVFTGGITGKLKRKAQEFFDAAQREKVHAKALELVNRAEAVYPRLEGLRDFKLKLLKAFPILHVSMRSLPEAASPLHAITDAEKRACELVFESLMAPIPDAERDYRYEPMLSDGRPRLIPLGRHFQLVRDAAWSNGEAVMGTDVRATISQLKEMNRGESLIEAGIVNRDPTQISITLKQGVLDPLQYMTFKVLPQGTKRDDDKPIGSGPFVFKGLQGNTAVFTANPYYQREGRLGQPLIREIHFVQSRELAKDFGAQGQVRMAVDLTAREAEKLRSVPEVSVHVLQNRRIYFLAVNHRVQALKNVDLRRALAHGMDRDAVLDECFRGEDKNIHRPLQGPFPPGCWACCDKPMRFHQDLAKSLAEKLKNNQVTLSLKYPDDDEEVGRACQMLKKQIEGLDAGIKIRLDARPRRTFHDEVERKHDFDLAYYHFDYEGDDYNLFGLLDTSSQALAPGGRNFLGYENDDAGLESAMRKAGQRRDPARIRELMHDAQKSFCDRMPFIPLWQLDTILAIHSDLKIGMEANRLHPLRIFTDAEQWKLQRSDSDR